MNKKTLIIGGCALAVVAIVVALIFIFTGGGDAYRSIKVFEIDGSCKVDRDGDSLDAFKNMALSSGDSLTVGEGSFARLKLDDDKYVYLEANTKINLTATGTANDSKTMVYIERGSMLTEVKKKLSATSSYDIVTPNTTMSIRGTKTLTQVLEDAVTGHVQTSNAVLEGQVKIKAVKVKADGTVVSVEKDLGAGEGNAFNSSKEELVSQEEMQAIADTGASVNGIKVEIVSEEDADVVFDVATFEASFLENVKNILVADAQAETGEEGLSQEQIDAINAQLGEVLESFDVISTESQNAINAAASGETQPEPTPEITPEPTPEATSESVWSWENIAVTETEDAQDEGTTLVDGDTNLVVIDDTDEADDTADRDNGADEVATEGDDNDDTADEDGEEADETDEDEASDEDDNAGEDDVDDADDVDDEDKSDEEGEEENTDEEDADKEDGEDEEGEDEESEEERLAREEAERLEREAQEEAERLAAEQAQQEAQQSQSSSSSSTSESTDSGSNSLFNSKTWSVQYRPSSSQQGDTPVNISAKLVFESENGQILEANNLPSNGNPSSLLPGYENSGYEALCIATNADTSSSSTAELSSTYRFYGWYASDAEAEAADPNKRIMTYSQASSTQKLYPSVVRTTSVLLMNPYGQKAGKIMIPEQLPDNIVDCYYESDSVILFVKSGTTLTLPMVESGTITDRLYISKVPSAGVYTSLYCYSTNGLLDVPKLYLSGSTQTEFGEDKVYYVSGAAPTVAVEEETIILFMYFTSEVEIRIATNGGEFSVSEKYPETSIADTVTIEDMARESAPQSLPGAVSNSENDLAQKWTVTAKSSLSYDYVFKTVYYGRAFDTPLFTRVDNPNDADQYNRELLCNYKLVSNGPTIRYASSEPVSFESGYDRWIDTIDRHDTGAQYDTDGKCILTAQLVDWVIMDMRMEDVYQEDRKASVGKNIPYVIYDSEKESTGYYKFAVSPIDLYAETESDPIFGFTVNEGTANDYLKYIYAPDDIIYPWNTLGAKRTVSMSNSPIDEYATLAQSSIDSYSYVGVESMKLSGYAMEFGSVRDPYWYTLSNTYRLNERIRVDYINEYTNELEESYYTMSAVPCVSGGLSVANKTALNMITGIIKGEDSQNSTEPWDEGNRRMTAPVVLEPVYAYVTNVTVRLEYNEEVNSTGSYAQKTGSLLSKYRLVVSGVTWECFSQAGNSYVDISNIKLDYAIEGGGFVNANIGNCIYRGDDGYYLSYGRTNGPNMGAKLSVENNEIIIELSYGRFYLMNGDNDVNKNSISFIRGLVAFEPVTFDTYKPNDVSIAPAQGESYKYSCFMTSDTRYKYARVFTASDTFTASTVYGTGTVDGVIMDISGSDNVNSQNIWSNEAYGFAYYGGIIKAYTDSSYTYVGTVASVNVQSISKQITRTSAKSLIGQNIAEFLGIKGENGGFTCAGLFEFMPYAGVRILGNSEVLQQSYVYSAEQYDTNVNTGARRPAPWYIESSDSYVWKTISQAVTEEMISVERVNFDIGSEIHLIPEGYLLLKDEDVEMMVYVGAESSTVQPKGSLTSIDASTYKVNVEYLMPEV